MHLAAFARDCRDTYLHVAYLRDFLPDNISDRMFDVRLTFSPRTDDATVTHYFGTISDHSKS